jgi:hypothetical protein
VKHILAVNLEIKLLEICPFSVEKLLLHCFEHVTRCLNVSFCVHGSPNFFQESSPVTKSVPDPLFTTFTTREEE